MLEQLDSVDWLFVGPEHFEELGHANSRTTSLRGNLEQIWNRLHPDALLLVRCFEHERKTVWDEYRADTVLSVLNLAFLLSGHEAQNAEAKNWPAYVFRVRYREYCDLPLSFNMGGTRSTGHTGRMGLLSPQVKISLSSEEISKVVDLSPPILKRILARQKLSGREVRLKEAAIQISQAFDTLSPGAFASQLVAMGENLVDSQSDDSANMGQWKRRVSRMKALMRENAAVVDTITNTRHNYVHGGKQPSNDLPAFKALAFGVEAWAIVANMLEKHENAGEIERILDCSTLASESAVPELLAISRLIPEGPSARVSWISKYLAA